MSYRTEDLAAILDDVSASSGNLGYILLIDQVYASLTVSSVNLSTDVITTTASHGLVTGTKVRLSSTGTNPGTVAGAISSTTDFRINVLSGTTFSLHETLSDAIADVARVDLVDAGSGTITVLEQALDPTTDIKEVIINHELSHTDYTRKLFNDVGATNTATAQKPSFTWTQSVSVGEADLKFRFYFILIGGNSTIGSTTGTRDALIQLASEETITAGNSKLLQISLRARTRNSGVLFPA